MLQHIHLLDENPLIWNIAEPLTSPIDVNDGIPSLKPLPHASPGGTEGLNCKTAPDLKALKQRHLREVIVFSVNDEMVCTGFHKLAHYWFALCVGKRHGRAT